MISSNIAPDQDPAERVPAIEILTALWAHGIAVWGSLLLALLSKKNKAGGSTTECIKQLPTTQHEALRSEAKHSV